MDLRLTTRGNPRPRTCEEGQAGGIGLVEEREGL